MESEGVVFTRVNSLLTTGNEYIVPILLEEETLTAPLNKLQEATNEWYQITISQLQEIDEETGLHTNKILLERVQGLGIYLNNRINQLKKEVGNAFDSESYQPYQGRKKRNIASVVGPLVNLVNSILTQRRIDKLHVHLGDLNTQLDTHNEVITVMQTDIQFIKDSQARLQLAMSVTQDLLNATTEQVSVLQRHILLLNACDQLYASLADVEGYANDVTRGLLKAYRGRIERGLIKEDVLTSILTEMKKSGHTPLFPARNDYLELYYDLISVVPRPITRGQLMLYICIPLMGSPSVAFDVFKVETFPLKVPGSDLFQERILEDEFLVISDNRDHYIRPKLEQCRSFDSLYICTAHIMYSTHYAPNCMTQLFLGRDKPALKCPRKVLRDFYPVFRMTPEGMAYSTSERLDIAVYCDNANVRDPTSPGLLVMMLGAGLINRIPGCQLRAATIVVPAGSTQTGEGLIWKSRNMVSKLPLTTSTQIQTLTKQDLAGSDDQLTLALLLHDVRRQKHEEAGGPSTTYLSLICILVIFILANAILAGFILTRMCRAEQRQVAHLGLDSRAHEHPNQHETPSDSTNE